MVHIVQSFIHLAEQIVQTLLHQLFSVTFRHRLHISISAAITDISNSIITAAVQAVIAISCSMFNVVAVDIIRIAAIISIFPITQRRSASPFPSPAA